MNRTSILTLFLLIFSLSLWGQAKPTSRAIREATEAERDRFNLDAGQVAQMEVIQTQRLTNLAAINVLKEQDYMLYLAKKRSLRHYVEMATERLLTEAQRPVLERMRRERATQRAALQARLKREGVAPTDMDRALLEWEENRE